MKLTCSKCGCEKDEKDFYKAKNKRGRQYRCKECTKKNSTKVRKSHPEKVVVYNKKYRDTHPETVRKHNKALYDKRYAEKTAILLNRIELLEKTIIELANETVSPTKNADKIAKKAVKIAQYN